MLTVGNLLRYHDQFLTFEHSKHCVSCFQFVSMDQRHFAGRQSSKQIIFCASPKGTWIGSCTWFQRLLKKSAHWALIYQIRGTSHSERTTELPPPCSRPCQKHVSNTFVSTLSPRSKDKSHESSLLQVQVKRQPTSSRDTC